MLPMTEFDTRTWESLLGWDRPHSVSILMPTEKAGKPTRQNPIRFKNLLVAATHELKELGLRSHEIDARLGVAYGLVEDYDFWQNQRDGFAGYFGEDAWWLISVPGELQELSVTGRHFHLAPLLPLRHREGPFYLLALDEHDVRLYRVRRPAIEEIKIEGAKTDYRAYIGPFHFENQMQWHTGTPQRPTGERRRAMYHSQGGRNDERVEKRHLTDFCSQLDQAVRQLLAEFHRPLILAGTEPMVGIYRHVSHYQNIHPSTLWGALERKKTHELHREALALRDESLQREREDHIRDFQHVHDRRLTDLGAVLRAARYGQIGAMFLQRDAHRWGRFDEVSGKNEQHETREPGDEDLVNLAAVYTAGAQAPIEVVTKEELEVADPVAAVTRYEEAADQARESA